MLRVLRWSIPAIAVAFCAILDRTWEASAQPRALEFRPVLELFTSQGCSSCPPADALLGKLAKRDDVIALSLPVDYWDYLGWKDTLALPSNGRRQRDYAKLRGDGRVYTPQLVVSGIAEAIGHNTAQIERAIQSAQKRLAASAVRVYLDQANDSLVIKTEDAPNGSSHRSATVWLAHIRHQADVHIKRGENAGRTVTYYNIVRELVPIGMWRGETVTLNLPKAELMQRGYDGCVVFLQKGTSGPILGAAVIGTWH